MRACRHGYAERRVGDHQGTKGIPGGTAGPYRVSLEVSGHGQSSYEVKDESSTAAAVDFFNREGKRFLRMFVAAPRWTLSQMLAGRGSARRPAAGRRARALLRLGGHDAAAPALHRP